MKVEVPKSVLFRDLSGEAVLLELESGLYYGLDEVGTRIWSLLEQHGDPEVVRRQLVEEYEVSAETIAADLEAFLQTLSERGLIALRDE